MYIGEKIDTYPAHPPKNVSVLAVSWLGRRKRARASNQIILIREKL